MKRAYQVVLFFKEKTGLVFDDREDFAGLFAVNALLFDDGLYWNCVDFVVQSTNGWNPLFRIYRKRQESKSIILSRKFIIEVLHKPLSAPEYERVTLRVDLSAGLYKHVFHWLTGIPRTLSRLPV